MNRNEKILEYALMFMCEQLDNAICKECNSLGTIFTHGESKEQMYKKAIMKGIEKYELSNIEK